MFDRVIASLEAELEGRTPESLDPMEIPAAAAALYFQMIVADGVITKEELVWFRDLLRKQFDLDDEMLDAVTMRGIREQRDSPGMFPFTAILNERMDEKAKREVMLHLRELAEADGEVDAEEADLLLHVASLLHLD